mmetsp:Transcript_92578/g.299542  ORF Transcript_92578/g.299542 Transcript_92578/m.299542 type:complete len:201 (-) Transcript_92578:101-703(-)
MGQPVASIVTDDDPAHHASPVEKFTADAKDHVVCDELPLRLVLGLLHCLFRELLLRLLPCLLRRLLHEPLLRLVLCLLRHLLRELLLLLLRDGVGATPTDAVQHEAVVEGHHHVPDRGSRAHECLAQLVLCILEQLVRELPRQVPDHCVRQGELVEPVLRALADLTTHPDQGLVHCPVVLAGDARSSTDELHIEGSQNLK